jgi:hypothetical protein
VHVMPLWLRFLIVALLIAATVRLGWPPIRRDITKFRGWRARVRRRKARAQEPPAAYRRDNALWRLRVAGLVAGFTAVATLGYALFFVADGESRGLLLMPSVIISLLGAGIWGVLADRVR